MLRTKQVCKCFFAFIKRFCFAALSPTPLAEKFKDETRKMVGIMVEMERNYITAEYFRTIQMGKMPDGKVMYTLDGEPGSRGTGRVGRRRHPHCGGCLSWLLHLLAACTEVRAAPPCSGAPFLPRLAFPWSRSQDHCPC